MHSISRNEALNLHKAMWSGLKYKYGDNCSNRRRLKEEWLKLNGFDEPAQVKDYCFLCEYAYQQIKAHHDWKNHLCYYCPIDWRPQEKKETEREGEPFACENFLKTCWQEAPISTILNLPERKTE